MILSCEFFFLFTHYDSLSIHCSYVVVLLSFTAVAVGKKIDSRRELYHGALLLVMKSWLEPSIDVFQGYTNDEISKRMIDYTVLTMEIRKELTWSKNQRSFNIPDISVMAAYSISSKHRKIFLWFWRRHQS